MEIKLIHHLARIMKRADLTELEVDDAQAGLRVHLVRGSREGQGAPLVHVMQGPASHAPAPAAPQPHYGAQPQYGSETGERPRAATSELPPGVVAFKSPMVGTFYRSASPDSDPYVEVGSRVKDDSVLCIIEAMKVMNEIKSEYSGVIVEMLVQNAEPVEFGQPLFLIQKT
ncbi:MAG: acetyl-CoA carboxylase biotin carboxyl carrier protein [Planctomycetaceae bacterium]|nr:acetyl-CoA carboxylase biotin carboxyl carrier protein [Planctomycetaceae bacterium]